MVEKNPNFTKEALCSMGKQLKNDVIKGVVTSSKLCLEIIKVFLPNLFVLMLLALIIGGGSISSKSAVLSLIIWWFLFKAFLWFLEEKKKIKEEWLATQADKRTEDGERNNQGAEALKNNKDG